MMATTRAGNTAHAAARIAWIDSCKGFAMFLVVLAHVIAWMFADWNVITTASPTPSWLWRLVYAFHMPLLMFISGYLCARRRIDTWGDLGRLSRKLALGLLVPDVVMSLFRYVAFGHSSNYLVPGSCSTYWYLEVLFLFALSLGLIDVFSRRIANPLSRVCLMCFIFYLLLQGDVIINGRVRMFHLTKCASMLPYFVVGVVVSRCCFFESILNGRKRVIGFFVVSSVIFLIAMKYRANLAAWAGVFASICVCHLIPEKAFFAKVFSYIGKTSIQIYILHSFVKGFMPDVGCIIRFESVSFWLTSLRGGAIICALYQLFVASLFSTVIIAVCVAIPRVMRRSEVLSKLCFGRVLT